MVCLPEHVPYSGKFSYGANFRIFRMKPRDTKIKTAKILTVEILTSNFERAIEHVEAASKRWRFITVFLAFERPSRLQWTHLTAVLMITAGQRTFSGQFLCMSGQLRI